MTTYRHIVQIHPVENGEPNLYKVLEEFEYEFLEDAESVVWWFNETWTDRKAVYVGMVNDETGELV